MTKITIGAILMLPCILAAILIAQSPPPPAPGVPPAWRWIQFNGQRVQVWGQLSEDGKTIWWKPSRQPPSPAPESPSFETDGVRVDKLATDRPKLRASDPETRRLAIDQLAKVEADAQVEAGRTKPCPPAQPEPEKIKVPTPIHDATESIRQYVLLAVAGVLGLGALVCFVIGVIAYLSRPPPDQRE